MALDRARLKTIAFQSRTAHSRNVVRNKPIMKKISLVIFTLFFTKLNCFGQVTIPNESKIIEGCEEVILTDTTSYFQTSWIKLELAKEELIEWSKEYHENWWSEDIEETKTDSIVYAIYLKSAEEMETRMKEFKSTLLKDDVVLYYRNSDNDWTSLSGEDGLIVLRDCVIIKKLVLSRS